MNGFFESDTPDATSRGMISDRPLLTTIGQEKNKGILEILGLNLELLRDKKSLNIGIGKGKALRQALEMGLDQYGVDIGPALRHEITFPSTISGWESIAQNYPGRLIAVDATSALPFKDGAFDIVFSPVALPSYSRNISEAITSICEMIRVSKGLVVFDINWNPIKQPTGLIRLGIVAKTFPINMQTLLNELREANISWELMTQNNLPPTSSNALHIDTTHVDYLALQSIREKLLTNTSSLES